MRLKQIDLFGFKSFADKVSLVPADGVTAIVGPNGSGKSNIADAVRWVLGEQSARVLRGTKMEDVIFNGSEKRRPLSYCEVSLTFDNEDHFLDIPHTEVCVSRRYNRNGDSEYLINHSPCRMRDIVSLFYDTGVGREGYSIIGQGKIEEILSNKGEERRAALEEAAGVMKYKMRREEAQRKLHSVNQDMLRVDDIIHEIEGSLEPLAQQSEEARAFLALREELKMLEINIFVEQYERNRDRVAQLSEEAETMQQEEALAGRREQAVRDQEALLQDKLSLTEQLLSKAQEKARDQAALEQRMLGEINLLSQQMAHLQEEKSRLEEEKADILERRAEVCRQLDALEEKPEEGLDLLKEQVEILEQQADSTAHRAEQLENELDGLKQKLMDAMDTAGDRKARVARMETIRQQALQRGEELGARKEEAARELAQLERERAQAAEEKAVIEESLAFARESAKTQQEDMRQKNEAVLALGQAVQRTVSDYRQALHILKTQEELKRDFEGYMQSVRRLLQDLTKGRIDDGGVSGAVGALLQVPQAYEKAVDQALGAGLQNVVVENEQTAKKLIAYLRQREYGRVTFLPITALRPRTFSASEKQRLTGRGVCGCAVDLVHFPEHVRPAMEYLLGRTLVVEDMDAAIEVCRRNAFSFRCVTLQGDMMQSGGAMTGGSVRERGLISRDRLIEQAREKVNDAKQQARALQTQYQQETRAYEECRDAVEAQQKRIYALEAELAAAEQKLDTTQFVYRGAKDRSAQLETEGNRIQEALAMAEKEIQAGQKSGTVDEQALRGEIQRLTGMLSQARTAREAAAARYQEGQLSLASQTTEQAAARASKERLAREEERLCAQQERVEKGLRLNAEQAKTTQAQQTQAQQTQQNIQQEAEENGAALSQLETQRGALRKEQKEYQTEREQLAIRITALKERQYKAAAQAERLEAEFESIQTRMWNEYELTYAMAKQQSETVQLQKATQRANRLHAELRQMTYVNPGAIEEYQRVSERHAFLTAQREDLQKAREDLERMIEELTDQMQKQFIESFDKINENFRRIFPLLFGGGQAQLILEDKENALTCDIDIMAQPPGKKPRYITLLSGGERALTAIALLFAMLEMRATPFCILDEIEAALDEENLVLFAHFMKTYASKTQFLVITHRRPSMEAATALYGIAMEEKGVSKVVSVKFEEVG